MLKTKGEIKKRKIKSLEIPPIQNQHFNKYFLDFSLFK